MNIHILVGSTKPIILLNISVKKCSHSFLEVLKTVNLIVLCATLKNKHICVYFNPSPMPPWVKFERGLIFPRSILGLLWHNNVPQHALATQKQLVFQSYQLCRLYNKILYNKKYGLISHTPISIVF